VGWIRGMTVPILLRGGREGSRFELVGSSYVHGVHHVEGELQWRTCLIVWSSELGGLRRELIQIVTKGVWYPKWISISPSRYFCMSRRAFVPDPSQHFCETCWSRCFYVWRISWITPCRYAEDEFACISHGCRLPCSLKKKGISYTSIGLIYVDGVTNRENITYVEKTDRFWIQWGFGPKYIYLQDWISYTRSTNI